MAHTARRPRSSRRLRMASYRLLVATMEASSGLRGTLEDWATGRLVVDFSAKVLPNGYTGPQNLGGYYVGDRIKWDDGNQWLKEIEPPWRRLRAITGRIALEGVFEVGAACAASASTCDKTSFSGLRMLSDADGVERGHHLTVIGSDDGMTFWKVGGTVERSSGRLVVDFSQVGGGNKTGMYERDRGTIRWDDDGKDANWQLVAPQGPTVLWPSRSVSQ